MDRELQNHLDSETPGSVSPNWKPDGTGFRTTVPATSFESGWQSTTRVKDEPIEWVAMRPKLLYLVEDNSSIFKEYKDRYFIYSDPNKAIVKFQSLTPKDVVFGSVLDPTPETLVVGRRFFFKQEYYDVSIIAIQPTE